MSKPLEFSWYSWRPSVPVGRVYADTPLKLSFCGPGIFSEWQWRASGFKRRLCPTLHLVFWDVGFLLADLQECFFKWSICLLSVFSSLFGFIFLCVNYAFCPFLSAFPLKASEICSLLRKFFSPTLWLKKKKLCFLLLCFPFFLLNFWSIHNVI